MNKSSSSRETSVSAPSSTIYYLVDFPSLPYLQELTMFPGVQHQHPEMLTDGSQHQKLDHSHSITLHIHWVPAVGLAPGKCCRVIESKSLLFWEMQCD